MIGFFAGRGDVVVAMGLAFVIGIWAGWQLKRLKTWWADFKFFKKKTT